MAEYYDATNATVKNNVYLMEAIVRGPSSALFAYRMSRTLERAAKDRDALKKGMEGIMAMANENFAEFHAGVDRDLMVALWKLYMNEVPFAQQPKFLQDMNGDASALEDFANKAYETSIYMDAKRFAMFMENPDSATLANDPLTKVANDFRTAYFGSQDATLAAKKAKAYRLLTEPSSLSTQSPQEVLADAYAQNTTDEFLEPVRFQPTLLEPGDGLVCFNFRPDRVRQLIRALACADFEGFPRERIDPLHLVT
jgi:bisphosphoglycerate-independent phosphoglycerate mutase (AlkP superfamily)